MESLGQRGILHQKMALAGGRVADEEAKDLMRGAGGEEAGLQRGGRKGTKAVQDGLEAFCCVVHLKQLEAVEAGVDHT